MPFVQIRNYAKNLSLIGKQNIQSGKGTSQNFLIQLCILFIITSLLDASAKHMCCKQKLRCPDLCLIKVLPKFPKRVIVQRVLLLPCDNVQIVAKHLLLAPRVCVHTFAVFANQMIQLFQYTDICFLSICKKRFCDAFIHINLWYYPLLLHIIKPITGQLQKILFPAASTQQLLQKHLLFSRRVFQCLKRRNN